VVGRESLSPGSVAALGEARGLGVLKDAPPLKLPSPRPRFSSTRATGLPVRTLAGRPTLSVQAVSDGFGISGFPDSMFAWFRDVMNADPLIAPGQRRVRSRRKLGILMVRLSGFHVSPLSLFHSFCL
jgi:hypothetical protein